MWWSLTNASRCTSVIFCGQTVKQSQGDLKVNCKDEYQNNMRRVENHIWYWWSRCNLQIHRLQPATTELKGQQLQWGHMFVSYLSSRLWTSSQASWRLSSVYMRNRMRRPHARLLVSCFSRLGFDFPLKPSTHAQIQTDRHIFYYDTLSQSCPRSNTAWGKVLITVSLSCPTCFPQ